MISTTNGYSQKTDDVEACKLKHNYKDSIVHKSLTDIYKADKSKKLWMGENYRKEWSTKVSYPVFDIGTEKGGLKILKRGGGQQTTSVRLEDKDGRQYVLRSVNKNVSRALDIYMQNTFVQDIVQDGISASHPFAALTVPDLAEAAGVFHTNPKMVWVPDDPRLGIYRKDIGNNVFLFEERPGGETKDVASFGNSKKIISTPNLIEKTRENHKHQVDQKSVLRARLFDILINDWDRHDDQWRWARFKENVNSIYKPVPRDRDQVYFVNQGILMWLASRDFMMPKFQGFDHKIKNVKGLGFNARFFDRSFLTGLEREDWIREAIHLQNAIDDATIDKAINKLPPDIYALSGEEIKAKLRSRLNHLQEYAEEYYEFLARNVDVVGTNERDYFKVSRLKDGGLDVKVYEMSDKKGKIKDLKFERNFVRDETEEVRLYGLGGKDKFDISGITKKSIKVRIIGGKGKDEFNDNSEVKGGNKKTIIYDRSDKINFYSLRKEAKLKTSKNKSVNEYNRKQFRYNKNIPLINFGYNEDDGVVLGLGLNLKRYNFRDSSFQKIIGNYAYGTTAFSMKYDALFTGISQKYDLRIDAEISMPRSVDNYFGMGNETEKEFEEKYYRVRYKLISFKPELVKQVGKKAKWSFGPFYEYVEIRDTADRFIGSLYPDLLSESAYEAKSYLGLTTSYEYDKRNDLMNPTRGTYWVSQLELFKDISDHDKNLMRIKSDLSFYMSFRKDPRLVLAIRFGGAVNFGDYDFYHSNFLGGKSNLRGYVSNRYAGNRYLYQNTELRFKLMSIRRHFFVGQWGILVFNDFGKVWVKDENSDKWHNGYGFGTWLNPFNATIVNLTYGMSEDEDGILTFSIRFLF